MFKLENRINSQRIKLAVFVLLGALSLFFQEALARGGPWAALRWFASQPHVVIANLALIFCIMSFFAALFGRVVSGSSASFIILLLVSLVNYEKISRLQQPFFAWDILYFEQIFALLPSLSIKYFPRSLIHPFAASIFILFCILINREKPLGFRSRISLFAIAPALLSLCIYHRELPKSFPSFPGFENAVWDQRSNYEKNGFLLAFMLNVQPILIDEPQEYCETAIHGLLDDIVSSKSLEKLKKMDQPINLVLFVSESFYDLLHVKYEAAEDPLRNFRELQSRFPSFRMVSPTFGGGTSNVEFEMLTGLSNAFLPPGAVPYDHYLKRGAPPSIPQILREHGYKTIAIHPYHDWFWNRREVYPKLGFEEFISLKDFSEDQQRGWFISDEAHVDRIIDTIESIDKPFFIYALSMQNHGEYDPHRYAPDEVEVKGDYPERLRLALQTYVTGLRDADRQLARLLEYMESRSEPIITLFCGDHLPSFGPEFALYRESGAIFSDAAEYALEDYFEMASVPCLLWANKEGLLDNDFIPEHMSPVYFPPVLLRQLGIDMPDQMRYLSNGIEKYPVIHRQFLWESGGNLVDFVTGKDNHPFLRGLEMLQYDILFGKRHALSAFEGRPAGL